LAFVVGSGYAIGDAATFLILTLSVAALAQDVGDNSHGFERQYRAVINALRDDDREQAKRAFDGFALPAEWFRETFGASGEAMQQQYKTEFDYFKYTESRRIQEQLNKPGSRFETEVRKQPDRQLPLPKPAPFAVRPLPSIEGVKIKIYGAQSDSVSPRASWANMFAYVNGAFRFFGGGGYPFWDPIRVNPPDLCAPNGRQPGGQLIDPAAPTYPDAAKSNGLQGPVSLLVGVAKDGSVSSVDVMKGDPLLTASATTAAKQWHYQPFMNCGEPVEAHSWEILKYSLDASGTRVEVVKHSDTVHISSGVAASLLSYKVNPTYPLDAQDAGIQGVVVLRVKISKDGSPVDIKLESGESELGAAAIDAVRQWRYTPYHLNGQPVDVETTVQINFTLRR